MNNLNFNYWLQGYFELNLGTDNALSDAQVKVIKEHLYLVKMVEPLSGFAAWLEGYLDADTSILASRGKLIADRLAESFKHVTTTVTSSQGVGRFSSILGTLPGDGTMAVC